jgi:hypothetical protein
MRDSRSKIVKYSNEFRIANKFIKNNKIYVEDERGMLRRLDKVSIKLYCEFVKEFSKGGYAKKFSNKNASRGLGSSGMTSPIAFRLDKEFFEEYDRLFKSLYSDYDGAEDFITLFFEQSSRPIAKLFKKKSGLGSVSDKIGDFLDS